MFLQGQEACMREKDCIGVDNERTGLLQANHLRYRETEPDDPWTQHLTMWKFIS